jgi:hypothetical protein
VPSRAAHQDGKPWEVWSMLPLKVSGIEHPLPT